MGGLSDPDELNGGPHQGDEGRFRRAETRIYQQLQQAFNTHAPVPTLTVVDTSLQMRNVWVAPGVHGSVACVACAMASAFYLRGVFKGAAFPLSLCPRLTRFDSASIPAARRRLYRQRRDGELNVQALLRRMLYLAQMTRARAGSMPRRILILTDRDVESTLIDDAGSTCNLNVLNIVRQYYRNERYTMPEFIFWEMTTQRDNPAHQLDFKAGCWVVRHRFSTRLAAALYTTESVMGPAVQDAVDDARGCL